MDESLIVPASLIEFLFSSQQTTLKKSKETTVLLQKLLNTLLQGLMQALLIFTSFTSHHYRFLQYTTDIIERTCSEAIHDGSSVLTTSHLQRVLPQLLLEYL